MNWIQAAIVRGRPIRPVVAIMAENSNKRWEICLSNRFYQLHVSKNLYVLSPLSSVSPFSWTFPMWLCSLCVSQALDFGFFCDGLLILNLLCHTVLFSSREFGTFSWYCLDCCLAICWFLCVSQTSDLIFVSSFLPFLFNIDFFFFCFFFFCFFYLSLSLSLSIFLLAFLFSCLRIRCRYEKVKISM